MMPPSRRVLVLCTAIALVGMACQQNSETAGRQPKAGTKPGGNLIVGITEPASIEPTSANAFESSGNLVIRTICDSLIQFDPVDGKARSAIAESWIISDEGERMTVKIRKDILFHNGEEVTAEDIVFSLSRVASKDYGSPVATQLEPILGYELVHGDASLEAQEDVDERLLTEMQGLRVLDNYSFEIRLKEKRADFLRILGHPLASPLPKQAVDRGSKDFAKEPDCTGPYRLSEPWEPGMPSIKVERFEDYYARNEALTSGGKGYPDTIEFRIFPDREAALNAFLGGNVDIAPVPQSMLEQARGPNLVSGVTGSLEYIGLPAAQEPFSRRSVRIAFSQALDRQAISNSVFAGLKTPATSFLPPTLGNYHRKDACGNNTPIAGDINAARESLVESNVDLAGKALKFYFNDEFDNRRMVEAVASQWSAAFGIQFELQPMGWDPFLEKGVRSPGFDGPFRLGWAPQYQSADGYLQPLFHSGSIGQNNLGWFANEEFDNALERRARRAETDADLEVEYKNLEDIACAEMPIVPVAFGGKAHAVRKEKLDSAVSDVFADVTTGDVLLRELFVK